MGGDAGADVHRNAPRPVICQLHLARVQPGANLDTEVVYGFGNCAGAVDRPSRPVERCEEAVTCGVDLPAAKTYELRPDDTVMALDEVVPLAVAELDRLFGRADDVGEEHRNEHTVDLRLLPGSLFPHPEQKFPDRLQHLVGVHERRVVVAC
jgi:hypothetical protein